MFISDVPQPVPTPFTPFIDRLVRSNKPSEVSLPYTPHRPAPVISVTHLVSSSSGGLIGSNQMTWEGFLAWLSQFPSIVFGNRFASREREPDTAAIESILLSDFSSLKLRSATSLDADDFSLLQRSNSMGGEAR